jgi:signal peptide peptidase SppA
MQTEFASEPWAMEPKALEVLLTRLEGILAPLASGRDDMKAKRRPMFVEDGVATVSISGVLLKSVPGWLRGWGVDATGYDEIREDVKSAVESQGVHTIRLAVNSPGGQVAGVKEAADAVFAARAFKRVVARIEDIGASGAYWLASQADTIEAGPNALVGSIGVYSAYVDSSKAYEEAGLKVHLIASGEHKGMGVSGTQITKGQIQAAKEVIDGMAANFSVDVARGRGQSSEKVAEWATGRVWIADQALALGLVDRVGVSNEDIPSSGGRAAAEVQGSVLGEEGMSTITSQSTAAGAEEIRAKAAKEAQEGERKRCADIRAAFPKDPAFALEQIERGASIAEAKGAYADVLQAKLDVQSKELEEAKKAPAKAAVPVGAPPVAAEGDPSQAAPGKGYLERAKEIAEAKGISMRQAFSQVSKEEPALYAAYLAEVGAGHIYERRRRVDAAKK